jgi:dihydrodipicolinate synthase/N-acetylneuraminate lyase
MDKETARIRLEGLYVSVPTMFRDTDLELDLPAIDWHVNFLIDGGINTDTGVLLAGGAAGGFMTMTFAERLQVAEAIIKAADGRIPIIVGAQTTSTRELVALAQGAQQLGAEFIQVSPPFYFAHTEDDFFEYVLAASEAAPEVGIVVYNTFWTSSEISMGLVERLIELPNVVGLKWSVPGTQAMGTERSVSRFADKVCVIDNQLRFVTTHILGARGIELHTANYWPQWSVQLWQLLEDQQYVKVQKEMVRVVLPFYELWAEMDQYTGGDGYLDKLCIELIGGGSSRCRPPTRDVRDRFREQTRQMLLQCGVPGVLNSA